MPGNGSFGWATAPVMRPQCPAMPQFSHGARVPRGVEGHRNTVNLIQNITGHPGATIRRPASPPTQSAGHAQRQKGPNQPSCRSIGNSENDPDRTASPVGFVWAIETCGECGSAHLGSDSVPSAQEPVGHSAAPAVVSPKRVVERSHYPPFARRVGEPLSATDPAG